MVCEGWLNEQQGKGDHEVFDLFHLLASLLWFFVFHSLEAVGGHAVFSRETGLRREATSNDSASQTNCCGNYALLGIPLKDALSGLL